MREREREREREIVEKERGRARDILELKKKKKNATWISIVAQMISPYSQASLTWNMKIEHPTSTGSLTI